DYGMGAYIRAAVTLDTVLRIPNRDVYRDTALLISGGTGRRRAVHVIRESGYRQRISFLCVYFRLNVVYEINNIFSISGSNLYIQSFVSCVLPAFRNLNLNYLLRAGIDSCPVLLYNIVALSSVGSLCGS